VDGFIAILRSAAAWGAFRYSVISALRLWRRVLIGKRGTRIAIRIFKTEDS
jgi:hypothetical protein